MLPLMLAECDFVIHHQLLMEHTVHWIHSICAHFQCSTQKRIHRNIKNSEQSERQASAHWANCIANCSVVLSKPGSQQACVNAITPMEICSHTGVQRANRNALQHWSGQNTFPTVQCCSAKQAHSWLGSLQLHLWRYALHTGVQ